MNPPSFDSYSQNGEDVVLWRALQDIPHGRYIDVGANDPTIYSVSRAFYDRGWSGITVEPDPHFAQLQREQRPRDLLIEAAITARDGDTVTFHVVDGTGLSTLDDSMADVHAGAGYETHDLAVPTRRLDRILEDCGWKGKDIHFLSIDTEGSERQVLESADLTVWRPWILVIEATEPLSTESTRSSWESLVTKADYRLCLFDGLACWYVASERHDQLSQSLSYPACVLDNYTTLQSRQYVERVERMQGVVDSLVDDVVRWRLQAINRWGTTVADRLTLANLQAELQRLERRYASLSQDHQQLQQQSAGLHRQIAEFLESTSWQITRPVRSISGLLTRNRHR